MHCYLIAEAGVNHNGQPELAHRLIDAAADAGANAVKFQTFVPESLVAAGTAKAAYQERNQASGDDQLHMLQQLALPFSVYAELQQHCNQRGIDFLSSPFDAQSADLLTDELQLSTIKLGSGELTNGPLLWQLARRNIQLILSTGMANLDEIQASLGLLCHARQGDWEQPQTDDFAACFDPALLRDRVTLLHCTTAYPCPSDQVNLRAMDTLADHFGLPVGYSDHTQGIAVSLAAAARGACLIEKHFTMDRQLPGPDHAASLQPNELAELAAGLKVVTNALGNGDKTPHPDERVTAKVARKSLVAARAIKQGEPFTTENLICKRPGTGISPMRYWEKLGKTSSCDYAADGVIDDHN